jgi:hypothetical protein
MSLGPAGGRTEPSIRSHIDLWSSPLDGSLLPESADEDIRGLRETVFIQFPYRIFYAKGAGHCDNPFVASQPQKDVLTKLIVTSPFGELDLGERLPTLSALESKVCA